MIVGVSGLAGAGKDCIADILVRNHKFKRIGLADPMKRFCKELFGFTDEQLWGPSGCRNADDRRWLRPNREPLSPRFALQTMGTQWGRECSPDVWVRYAVDIAQRLLGHDGKYIEYSEQLGWYYDEVRDEPHGGVVIPDVRFLNEAAIIREAGGVVVRVTRNGAGLQGTAGQHPSELELNGMPDSFFDGTIRNEGSKEQLAASVGVIMNLLREAA